MISILNTMNDTEKQVSITPIVAIIFECASVLLYNIKLYALFTCNTIITIQINTENTVNNFLLPL